MTITVEQFTDAMELAVLQKGADYVYPVDLKATDDSLGTGGCYYRKDGQPSCIIGTALDILGLPTDPGDEGNSAYVVLNLHGIKDPVIRSAADIAQSEQDHGKPWGQALKAFRDTLTSAAAMAAAEEAYNAQITGDRELTSV